MANAASWKCVVVWADELRVAAKAIEGLYTVLRDKESTNDSRNDAMKSALECCYAALKDIEDDTTIVVCEGTAAKFVPRVTEIKK